MDFLNALNLKDENGNFNPAALISNIDKIEPMLPMLDGLMQTFKPEGSDGVFLMGSIEGIDGKSRPVLRLMGYKVVTVPAVEKSEGVEAQAEKKVIEITTNCVNKEQEPIKIDLLALIVEAGGKNKEGGESGLNTVFG